jgi:hypothetical protein
MLPGDPMRVYGKDSVQKSSGVGEREAQATDPTTIKPAEGNPLTGE